MINQPTIASTTIWIDQEFSKKFQTPIGSIDAPFTKVSDAVLYANRLTNVLSVNLKISPGDYSAEHISLKENIGWIFEGSVSGAIQLGDITWYASGDINPIVPQSYLLLRQVAPLSVKIEDGTTPAMKALLILENAAVLGNIASTTSIGVVVMQVSGISPAASIVGGQNVSSLILGDIKLPNASVGLTNTQVVGDIETKIFWAQGCQLNKSITCTGNLCQIKDTQLIAPRITFTNGAGNVQFDINTGASWISNNGVLVNGTLSFEANKLPKNVKIIDSNYAIKQSDNVIAITNETSDAITITLPLNPAIGENYSIVKYNNSKDITVVDQVFYINGKPSYVMSAPFSTVGIMWLGVGWVAS